ncbi:MAG: 2-hydroxyacid dehydrogenase [Pseudomonadota bacterium]
MRVAVFNTKPYDRQTLSAANAAFGHELMFYEEPLRKETCVVAEDAEAVCIFVNDTLDASVLACLSKRGVKVVALRCAGFNNVDIAAAKSLGMQVVRVPAYSPYAVAEHAVALMLTLNRKTHRAFNRVREGNFTLNGLLGFDMHGKTVGIVGTGRIGAALAHIMHGFGCRILAEDSWQNPACLELGVHYVDLATLLSESDIISLHCPLTPETKHLVNPLSIAQMKQGVMLINTGRGALVDTRAVIAGLKSRHIGSLGLDVYEQEEGVFFEDLSFEIIGDDLLERLLTFPNVIVTSHQGYFTHEALTAIAETTLSNLSQLERGEACANAL